MAPRILLLAALATLAAASCGPPVNNTPVTEIPKIASLEALMDRQATAADPQFAKSDAASLSDADYAGFADAAATLDATSKHIKDFSKGPAFDALADTLNQKAAALATAAAAKDAAGSKAALVEIKATCKSCHSQFR